MGLIQILKDKVEKGEITIEYTNNEGFLLPSEIIIRSNKDKTLIPLIAQNIRNKYLHENDIKLSNMSDKELLINSMEKYINVKIEKRNMNEIINYLNELFQRHPTKIDIDEIKSIIESKIKNMLVYKFVVNSIITNYGVNVDFIIPRFLFNITLFDDIEQYHVLNYIKNYISKILCDDLVNKNDSIFNKYDLLINSTDIKIIEEDIKITIPMIFKTISEFYNIISEYDSKLLDSIIKN